jgi:hypothetical protein
MKRKMLKRSKVLFLSIILSWALVVALVLFAQWVFA